MHDSASERCSGTVVIVIVSATAALSTTLKVVGGIHRSACMHMHSEVRTLRGFSRTAAK